MSPRSALSKAKIAEPGAEGPFRDELVSMLFGSIGPTAIIGLALTVLSAMSATETDGWYSIIIPLAAGLAGTARIAIVIAFWLQHAPKRNLRRWEALFSVALLVFAATVGAFALHAFQNRDPMTQMMAITVVVGFCAGVVVRISVRPRLAAAAVVIASLPAVAGCVLLMTAEYLAVAFILSALLVGSLQTVRETYGNTLQHIATRRRFEELAGLDPLTGLYNRGVLYQRLDALLATGSGGLAVHFLDLDRFKNTNDTHGHAAGDTVLSAVAVRLADLVSGRMIVARLGGDEFVVVQPDIASPEEARHLGERIVASVGRPCLFNGAEIEIGTSVGCAFIERGTATAAAAIALADGALYLAKQRGRGCVAMAAPSAVAA